MIVSAALIRTIEGHDSWDKYSLLHSDFFLLT